MSLDLDNGIIADVPVYAQIRPAEGELTNRHVLVDVRLLEHDEDHVYLESEWSILDAPRRRPNGPVRTIIARRAGVRVYMLRDPLSMPIYIIFTQFHRGGSNYHVAAAIEITEWIAGNLEVNVQFLRIRRRHLLRSNPIRIMRTRRAEHSPRRSASPEY
ncbi:hypothetical protein C8Q79DRAFT_1007776 [Trametes meyenii]|nr:hypothetical protein C8Q79DRAFT_1007776 [Trametes meyenii]